MKIIFMVLLVFAFESFAPGVCAIRAQDTTAIDSYIVRQARRERAEEYREARKVVAGNLNNDDTSETIVLYTIESQRGSNNYVQYLAVFVRRNGQMEALTRIAVGGKSRRSVDLISVEHRAIQLETLDYGPNDASCCPSIKGKTQFILVGRTLRELKSRN